MNNIYFILYDDDSIFYIIKILNCSEDKADVWRKAFMNNDLKKIEKFEELIKNNPDKINILIYLKSD